MIIPIRGKKKKKKENYPWFSINVVLRGSTIHTYFGDSAYSRLYYIRHLGEVAQLRVMSQEGKWLLTAGKYLLRANEAQQPPARLILLGQSHKCNYLVKTPQSLITNMVNVVEEHKKKIPFLHMPWPLNKQSNSVPRGHSQQALRKIHSLILGQTRP